MNITKLLREAQEQSKCRSNALNDAYKKIFGTFQNPNHFSFYLREELKSIRAQAHFKKGDDEIKALEQIVEDLNRLNSLLENSQAKTKYGELNYFKKELIQNITEYASKYQEARKKKSESLQQITPKSKNIEDVVKAAIYLSDFFERETYRDCVLNILSVRLFNTREGMRVFNEEYADKIKEPKYDARKDTFLSHIDSCNDFIRASDFEATPVNFSLDFKGRKTSSQGASIGSYRVKSVMRKRLQSSTSYCSRDMLKLESEIVPVKNLEKTNYDLLKAENIGKIERIRNSEFLNELEKILHLFSQSFELRLPRQDISRALSKQTKLLYDDVPNPDTDYFKLKGENYSLKIGVKAKGRSEDYKVYVGLEFRKL